MSKEPARAKLTTSDVPELVSLSLAVETFVPPLLQLNPCLFDHWLDVL